MKDNDPFSGRLVLFCLAAFVFGLSGTGSFAASMSQEIENYPAVSEVQPPPATPGSATSPAEASPMPAFPPGLENAVATGLLDKDKGRARSAFSKLLGMGKAAVPDIRGLLKRPNARLVRAALDLSEKLGPLARDTQDDLVGILKNPRWGSLRARAARILGGLGNQAFAAVPALIDSLKEPDLKIRQAVARALVSFIEQGKERIPGFRKFLEEKRIDWRNIAVESLVRFGPLLHPALPLVVKIVEKKSVDVSDLAISFGARLVPGIEKLVPLGSLTASVSSEDSLANSPANDSEAEQAEEAVSFEDVPAGE